MDDTSTNNESSVRSIFIRTVDEILKDKELDYEKRKCEDQYVAIVEITKHKVEYVINEIESRDENKIKEIEKFDIPTIALVLESPHKREYYNIPSPARGITGSNINSCFLGALAKFISINDMKEHGAFFISSSKISEGKYKLLLINAIQYQCSLGKLGIDNRKQKEDIFCKVWCAGGKKDFVSRLKKACPRIIINCCTGEKKRENTLMGKVQDAIDENFAGSLRLTGVHPSSAWFARGFEQL